MEESRELSGWDWKIAFTARKSRSSDVLPCETRNYKLHLSSNSISSGYIVAERKEEIKANARGLMANKQRQQAISRQKWIFTAFKGFIRASAVAKAVVLNGAGWHKKLNQNPRIFQYCIEGTPLILAWFEWGWKCLSDKLGTGENCVIFCREKKYIFQLNFRSCDRKFYCRKCDRLLQSKHWL